MQLSRMDEEGAERGEEGGGGGASERRRGTRRGTRRGRASSTLAELSVRTAAALGSNPIRLATRPLLWLPILPSIRPAASTSQRERARLRAHRTWTTPRTSARPDSWSRSTATAPPKPARPASSRPQRGAAKRERREQMHACVLALKPAVGQVDDCPDMASWCLWAAHALAPSSPPTERSRERGRPHRHVSYAVWEAIAADMVDWSSAQCRRV